MAKNPLDPYLWTLSQVFEKRMYSVPVYQRPYSWENTQVKTLMDDLFDAFDNSKKNDEGYFIGSIYLHDKNETVNGLIDKYDVIDGQQRITTIALLMLAIYTTARTIGVEETDATVSELRKALWKSIKRNEVSPEYKAITLNSIEKECFLNLYGSCFSNPTNVKKYCETYNAKNAFENRVIKNFVNISKRLEHKFGNETADGLLDFADFLLNYVQVIAIDATCSVPKTFSIFESINSKGKTLDEIDKIKSYIFSKIDEQSYDYYLSLWGNLIIQTKDGLYDYMYTFIRAYITFYRQNINVDNFIALSKKELLDHYKTTSVADGLKKLLDDMNEKVQYYKMLFDIDSACNVVKSGEFRFFFKIFTYVNYQHPKPLFLRCLEENASGKLSKQDTVDIIRETVKAMFEFLTICKRDSKDIITMFSTIMTDIYSRGSVSKSIAINIIADEFISNAINSEKLKYDLLSMDSYVQNKKIAVSLLSLYESTSVTNEDDKEKVYTSFDKAYTLLKDYGTTFSLDHLLVQSPDPTSPFMYYKDVNERLVLKNGHDFGPEIQTGMDYEQFERLVLNKIGNLRMYYKDENSAKQNDAIELEEYKDFTTYKKISDRGNDIVDLIIDKCLPMPKYDPNIVLVSALKEKALPKMGKLIEYGVIKPGDELFITIKPTESRAILVDENHVEFNGKTMKINDWGKEVSGWTSINIYNYTSVVGEEETLHQKRLHYMETHNDNPVS